MCETWIKEKSKKIEKILPKSFKVAACRKRQKERQNKERNNNRCEKRVKRDRRNKIKCKRRTEEKVKNQRRDVENSDGV